MPIYAYKCESCGVAKDVLQKMSDPPLEICPACSRPTFKKQVTAAGFQLKGSGWYATDFKGGGAGAATASSSGAPADSGAAAAPAEAKPNAPKADATPAPATPPASSGD
jgi:putative FmdB family regulatory protein